MCGIKSRDTRSRLDMMRPAVKSNPTSTRRWRTSLALLLTLFVSGCGTDSSQPQPRRTPVPTTAAPRDVTGETAIVARDVAFLKSQSYSVDFHVRSSIQGGQPLWIFHSVCTGSTDGHCQAVDAFRTQDTKPIWHTQPASVLAVKATTGGFSITSANYAPGDPLCCPSGAHVTDVYTWDGAKFVERGPLPKPPAA
jgi:hypothetical protein